MVHAPDKRRRVVEHRFIPWRIRKPAREAWLANQHSEFKALLLEGLE